MRIIKITVKLFATLRDGRFKDEIREYAHDASVSDVLRELEIPREEVSLIFVNGRAAGINSKLKEEDTLSLFPPVGGG